MVESMSIVSGVELTDACPLVRPQPRPDRRGRPSSADQHWPDHRQRLRPAVRAVPGQVQPPVDQTRDVEPLRQRCGRKQTGVRHEVRLVEGRGNATQIVVCSH